MLTISVGVIATLVFELCPQIVINLFGVQTELYDDFAKMTFRTFLALVTFTCTIKMSSIFLQAVGQPVKAAVVSLTRDIVCFVPLVILLPLSFGIKGALYAAPAADIVGIIVTVCLVGVFFKSLSKANAISESADTPLAALKPSKPGVIITVDREHGSNGKYIGQLVAEKLGIPYYYKEMIALAAQESGLASEFISDINNTEPGVLHGLYLTTEPVQQAIIAQEKIICKIAENGSCVIVGRAAGYVLRGMDNVVSVFVHAPEDYRVAQVMKIYGDTEAEGKRNVYRSDAARAAYFTKISGLKWGEARQYDLCLDSSVGVEKTAAVIVAYASGRDA